jgi:glycosyltransferase involved in cell wall biosynthesis
MPTLYRSVDCFVLPSRGEGWGRPHVEAMSMGLPVIATNWSGPTAFLTEGNGYPLAIDGLVTVASGPFKKYHKWAQPSLGELRRLMRHVVLHPAEARAKGERARADMVAQYAHGKVADVVVDRLWKINDKLADEGEL